MSTAVNHTPEFHTLEMTRQLKESGLPEKPAEAIVGVLDEALTTVVGRLDGRIVKLDGDVGDLKGEIGDLKGEIGNLKGEFADLRGEIGKLEGTLKGDIGDLKGDIGTLKWEIGKYIGMLGFAIMAIIIALRYLPPLPAGT
ncbi:MAG: hypothetical protein OXG56_11205 [Gammaproteobacteria bacterium]|nr:hypothetical protein [Gammaproteobacteria bacterium]